MGMTQQLLNFGIVVDNEYLHKYVALIQANAETPKIKFITQQHHIIPKYAFKARRLKIDSSAENLVNLAFSDHLLAHYYLMQCAASAADEFANANAIFRVRDNPHSKDLENWIINNKELLAEINRRRCELISLHHVDVSYVNNPRATKVYQYSLDAQLQQVYDTIKECAETIGYPPDSFRTRLSKHRLFLYDDKVFSKAADITESECFEYLRSVQLKAEQTPKRKDYQFTCEHCGKVYVKRLNARDAAQSLHIRHFCAACTNSGVMFKGVPKPLEQRQKMHDAAKVNMRKVCCIETGEIFESVSAAMRKYSHSVSGCLKGRSKTAHGYHWKYVDELQ